MTPRPGTPVIHPQMLAALRPVAEGAMLSTCTIREPQDGPGEFDPDTGQYVPTPGDVVYAGPCRVQALPRRSDDPELVGDNPVTLMVYQLTLAWSAPAVTVDHTVHMDSGPDDELTGQTLRILQTAYADLQAERHLLCQLNEG